MHDLTIAREIVIDAPVDVVWRTITEPDQITQWFADEVDVDVRPGASGTLTFDDKANARRVTAPILVEALDAPKRFAFRWSHDAGTTPDDTNSVLVEFTLLAEGDERTRLRVTETGLHDVAWPDERKTAYVDDHRHGWEVHLGRLQQMYASTSEQSSR
jgi:uncharacterized protein YndB with AHSA1/START domain